MINNNLVKDITFNNTDINNILTNSTDVTNKGYNTSNFLNLLNSNINKSELKDNKLINRFKSDIFSNNKFQTSYNYKLTLGNRENKYSDVSQKRDDIKNYKNNSESIYGSNKNNIKNNKKDYKDVDSSERLNQDNEINKRDLKGIENKNQKLKGKDAIVERESNQNLSKDKDKDKNNDSNLYSNVNTSQQVVNFIENNDSLFMENESGLDNNLQNVLLEEDGNIDLSSDKEVLDSLISGNLDNNKIIEYTEEQTQGENQSSYSNNNIILDTENNLSCNDSNNLKKDNSTVERTMPVMNNEKSVEGSILKEVEEQVNNLKTDIKQDESSLSEKDSISKSSQKSSAIDFVKIEDIDQENNDENNLDNNKIMEYTEEQTQDENQSSSFSNNNDNNGNGSIKLKYDENIKESDKNIEGTTKISDLLKENQVESIRIESLKNSNSTELNSKISNANQGISSIQEQAVKLSLEDIKSQSSTTNMDNIGGSNSNTSSTNSQNQVFNKTLESMQNRGNITQGDSKIDILNQVTNKINSSNISANQKVSVVLRPENLGKLQIEIVNTKDGIVANLTTANYQVKEALDKNIESLRQSLSSQGVNVNSLNIKVDEQNQLSFNNNNLNGEREFLFKDFNNNESSSNNGQTRWQNQGSDQDISESNYKNNIENKDKEILKENQYLGKGLINKAGRIDLEV